MTPIDMLSKLFISIHSTGTKEFRILLDRT
jgi:hypothetical protein